MPTINIPEGICIALSPAFKEAPESPEALKAVRQAAKSMIETAIEDGIQPAELPAATEAGVSFNLSFAGKSDKAIRSLSKAESIRESDAALKYLYAQIARGGLSEVMQATEGSFLARYLRATTSKTEERHHQNLCAQHILNALQDGKVGMIEAATGVGKTMAIIGASAELLRDKEFGRAVVAVPTIQLIRQFAKQHRDIEHSGLEDFPTGRAIVGRPEFLCVGDVKALIRSGTLLCDTAPVEAWLAAGGPACGIAESMESAYLVESLRHVSPEFPVEAVRLSIDTELDDPGAIAYAKQFADDETATREIIYCTHAMLAADLRRRIQAVRLSDEGRSINEASSRRIDDLLDAREEADSAEEKKSHGALIKNTLDARLESLTRIAIEQDAGMLPSWQYLAIDEAHAFESNVANVMAHNISLGRYIRHLSEMVDGGLLPKSSLTKANNALGLIRKLGSNSEYDLSEDSPLTHQLRAALQELADVILLRKVARGESKKHPAFSLAKLQANTICLGLKMAVQNRNARSLLQYSPVRAYPQLAVGRRSVRNDLQFLWGVTTAAVCISATLYLRKLDKDSAAYSASVLAIPRQRMAEFPVIRPAWTFSPVKALYVPENRIDNGARWLRPPSRRDKLKPEAHAKAESLWLDQVAEAMKGILKDAQGTLVLMGSYAAAQGLAERLADSDVSRVVASQNHSLHTQMDRFMALRQKGEKAVWIGVGGAWTGTDINGAHLGIENPEEDNILTDLVIPRLPFGLNKSMTHKSRIDADPGVPWELLDTAMRFKQGIGRLVRRPGLPKNRRIFVLDGRYNDPQFKDYLSIIARMMANYPIQTLRKEDL